jgi:hypothetical protein
MCIAMKRRALKIGLGLIVGGALGYAYYALVGCTSGGCPITSNPVMTTAYGALVGLAVTGL